MDTDKLLLVKETETIRLGVERQRLMVLSIGFAVYMGLVFVPALLGFINGEFWRAALGGLLFFGIFFLVFRLYQNRKYQNQYKKEVQQMLSQWLCSQAAYPTHTLQNHNVEQKNALEIFARNWFKTKSDHSTFRGIHNDDTFSAKTAQGWEFLFGDAMLHMTGDVTVGLSIHYAILKYADTYAILPEAYEQFQKNNPAWMHYSDTGNRLIGVVMETKSIDALNLLISERVSVAALEALEKEFNQNLDLLRGLEAVLQSK